MATNRLIYFIIAAFIAGILILIFIKYTSDKSVKNLIDDNEKLLNEFEVSSELKTLESNIWLIESKIRGTVTTNDTAFIEGVKTQIVKVKQSLAELQKIKEDDSTEEYVKQLEVLVQKKLAFSNEILTTYQKEGKRRAEAIIAKQGAKKLTDSILVLIEKISSLRQTVIFRVTTSVEESVKKVQRLDFFLIIFVIVSATVLFWYIVNAIRTQNRLIKEVKNSERKVKEAAQVKENFLANMSHEIRTPLNAILGFTNLLQRKNLDTESSLYVQTIQRSSESLLTIINDILDLSKIEAGMMRIEVAPFSLRGLLHSIETLFRTKANEKEIQFFADVDEPLPDTLEGDATRLTQILVNLIGNAIKFTNTLGLKRKSWIISLIASNKRMMQLPVNTAEPGLGFPL